MKTATDVVTPPHAPTRGLPPLPIPDRAVPRRRGEKKRDGWRVPKRAWLGVVALALAAAWLGWVGWRSLSAGGDLWGAIQSRRGEMVGPALVAVVVAIFLAERWWPAVRRPTLARAHVVDAGYLALFGTVVAPLLILVNTGFGVEAQRHTPFLLVGRLPLVPRVVVVAAVLVGMDAMNWLAHVANHRSAALWRLHALHHSQEDLNVFTTFRTHPLVHASYLPALVPALILGASGPVPGAAVVAYGCFVALAHANLRWTFGVLGRLFVSPAYHRLHHARTAVDGRGVVNFGFVLVGWDRLARPSRFPERRRTGADRDRRPPGSGGAGGADPQGARCSSGSAGPAFPVRRGDGHAAVIAVPAQVQQLARQLRATRDTPLARDLALLGARVGLAWIFIYHGAGTLFGAFGGAGIHRASMFYANVAHLHPATFFAVLGGIIECFGGAAVGLGVFGRIAAAALVGDMAVAMATVTFGNGIVSNAPGAGYELNVALATLALVVALLGTGRFSLDEAVRRFVLLRGSGARRGSAAIGVPHPSE